MSGPYWYQTQERAMAPGSGDGWPKIITTPHSDNARLVRQEGSPSEWRNEIATLREWVRVLEEEVGHIKRAWLGLDELDEVVGRAIGRIRMARAATDSLPTTLEGAGGEVRADAPSEAVEGV